MQKESDELWGDFDAKIAKVTKRSQNTDHIKDGVNLEMQKYLSQPIIDRKNCPLKWWKNTGSKQFPLLFECAQKYLCMLATSVPSERVFSTAGNVLNKNYYLSL